MDRRRPRATQAARQLDTMAATTTDEQASSLHVFMTWAIDISVVDLDDPAVDGRAKCLAPLDDDADLGLWQLVRGCVSAAAVHAMSWRRPSARKTRHQFVRMILNGLLKK